MVLRRRARFSSHGQIMRAAIASLPLREGECRPRTTKRPSSMGQMVHQGLDAAVRAAGSAARQPGEGKTMTLSNLHLREDRETGKLVLHLPRHAGPDSAAPQRWATSLLMYRIAVE